MDVAYADDADMSEENSTGKFVMNDVPDKRKLDDSSSDMEIVDESDSENTDGVSEEPVKNHSPSNRYDAQKSVPDLKQEEKLENGISPLTSKTYSNIKNVKVHPKSDSDLSEQTNGQPVESFEVVDILDEDVVSKLKICKCEDITADQKIEEMETRIEKLESELKEVAALEIALYSVVPDHGSSAYKVHTPARRLSRLYNHACENWSPDKQASVARNTVSGLILVSKSCGNDVSRLSFWLSNAIVFREIISQATEHSSLLGSPKDASQCSGVETKPFPLKLDNNSNGIKKQNKQRLLQSVDGWQEKRTFTAALEKVESWIFYRIVESIWWQTLAPTMQPPVGERSIGDQKQGNFSINLWKNAFHDALKRLCPVRAGEHECGCLPVIARKVLEQCIGRLDVAMFNAILRESAHEMPTDPVSDPIVDSRVLPISAGDLSFGSGAQLKYTVGSWSRWVSNFLGTDIENEVQGKGDERKKQTAEQKRFHLLNELSDLLMLPKDLILDPTIRMEVCPSISVPLVKRILCNFSPDEFSPDHVPGAVLEALNAECNADGTNVISFPYPASPVMYTPPTSLDISEKVTEANAPTPRLSRNQSFMQRNANDDDVEELESCVASVIGRFLSPADGEEDALGNGGNARYYLFREIWKCSS